MDFEKSENEDGVRFAWNYFPNNKAMTQKVVMPPSLLYTPLKEIEGMPVLEYQPQRCRLCSAVLNPFCAIDFRAKLWVCSCCLSRNNFTKYYAENISEEALPAELHEQYTTIEYVLPEAAAPPPPTSQQGLQPPTPIKQPAFIFVLDTAVVQEELSELKESIQEVLTMLPENALVGFITYDRMVFVHELLGQADFPRSFVFRGAKDYAPNQIREMLGLGGLHDPRGAHAGKSVRRFLAPIVEVEFALNAILDDLVPDPWPVRMGQRPLRASGCALNIAISLMEAGNCQCGRICLFIGGAITEGPGMIVSNMLEEQMRSHKDIEKQASNTKYMKNAMKFYEAMATRATAWRTVIDLFVSSLDQVGLLESKICADKTGGIILMTDTFKNKVFKDSFLKYFERDTNGDFKFGYRAEMEVLCSKDLKLCGIIGPCVSAKRKTPTASETEIGEGKTNLWFLGGIDHARTFALYLDVPSASPLPAEQPLSIQFCTSYIHSSGVKRLRVTTVKRLFAGPEDLREMAAGFDQEAAAVLMSRYAVFRCQKGEESIEVLRWIDRTLIRLVSRFASYKREDPSSFSLAREFNLYPGFLFHLRRGPFIQTFNASPDESSYYRALLLREGTASSLVMIQPILLEYKLNEEQPSPVNLDIGSLKNDVVLMLDTFFSLIIWRGETIKEWVDEGWHEQEGFEHVKELISNPLEDLKEAIKDRFPVPAVIECHPGHPQERKIKVKLNPGGKSQSANATVEEGNFDTEDVSFSHFMHHLIKLAVGGNN